MGLPIRRGGMGPRYPLYSSLPMPIAIGTLRGAAPIANPPCSYHYSPICPNRRIYPPSLSTSQRTKYLTL